MLPIHKNFSLKAYNTFHIDVKAKQFLEVRSLEELKEIAIIIQNFDLKYMILGQGSNTLFTQDFDGLVLYMNIKGKEIIRQNDRKVLIKACAGEVWHDFVLWALEQDYSGIENLALIPGRIGSAPIQNIGAYGVEIKDVIECVEVFDMETLKTRKIVNPDCAFDYRDSIFKRNKGKFIITAINMQLQKNVNQVNTSYGTVQSYLEQKGVMTPSPMDVAQAIIEIRQSKLPDYKVLGNAGSFFKNPLISKIQYEQLKSNSKDVPNFATSDEMVKIPAGWLIEKCGYKGKKIGNVGVHEHQALVLVNYGGATGNEVLALAIEIQKTVKAQFEIDLELEVNVV